MVQDEAPDVLITGAAGTIGTILLRELAGAHSVGGFDAAVDPRSSSAVAHGDVRARRFLGRVLRPGGIVIHLATGMHQGWSGLLGVDMLGTRNVLDAASAARTRRVIVASSNHVAGGFELDRHRGVGDGRTAVEPTDPIRPDGEYGVAKAFVEAYARFAAEVRGQPVSCLRIGSVAPIDDPAAYRSAEQFAHIPGGLDAVERRLRATWLHHDDLVRIVQEEIEATDRFRLRFAVSDNPDRFWSLAVHAWNP